MTWKCWGKSKLEDLRKWRHSPWNKRGGGFLYLGPYNTVVNITRYDPYMFSMCSILSYVVNLRNSLQHVVHSGIQNTAQYSLYASIDLHLSLCLRDRFAILPFTIPVNFERKFPCLVHQRHSAPFAASFSSRFHIFYSHIHRISDNISHRNSINSSPVQLN